MKSYFRSAPSSPQILNESPNQQMHPQTGGQIRTNPKQNLPNPLSLYCKIPKLYLLEMYRHEQLLLPTDLQVLHCSLMETLLKRLKHRKNSQSLSCSLDMQVTHSLSHTDLISIYFLTYVIQRLVYTEKHWQVQLNQQPPLLETICRKCFASAA